ncbi:phage major capsid protein [Devriesea agamarum]|uniref:phage major capsid protein n=1 Tax=Devriesea agamarum TaxID=472569 RepID=UPI00071D7C65|nr:phage major capsid protein [Devriesea agamarum]
MPTYTEQRDLILKQARDIAGKAANENRDLTPEEAKEINAKGAEIEELNEKIRLAKSASDLLASLDAPQSVAEEKAAKEGNARSLGEHSIKHLSPALMRIKGRRKGATADAPEFPLSKAAGDAHTTTTTGAGIEQPQVDTNIVHQYVERPTIASWLGSASITSSMLKYFVEKPFDPKTGGNFNYVAENTRKPGLNFPGYDEVTESLHKIAGWIKLSDEMAEDIPYIVSEINTRLLYQLMMYEEDQLLNGTGKGDTITGIFNRSGIQTEKSAGKADNLDAIYRALTKVKVGTGLMPDGVVMNPLDYETLRLSKDANGQYLGGGPFMGQYGQGGVAMEPPIWAKTPIVTTAVNPGTVLVGAGKQAATVYRKGGIRVEASNIDGEDFTFNRFTILAEMRELLAVRYPAAFVKVSLAGTTPTPASTPTPPASGGGA